MLALFNISFTYYFLWAFFFALLFSITANKLLKLFFFLASPYWILKTIIELFLLPSLTFCRAVLFSGIIGNLLLAIILLPFILMFIRMRMLPGAFRKIKRRTRRITVLAAPSLILIVLLLTFLFYTPFNELKKQPVLAHYIIDREARSNTLKLTSPAPLGRIYLADGSSLTSIESRLTSYVLPLGEFQDLLEIEETSRGFLDRRNISLNLAPRGKPFKLKLTLSSGEEFILFDANFPYIRESRGREYQILVGVNPPLPLLVQLTLPRDMMFDLSITLEYFGRQDDLEIFGRNKEIETRFTFKKRVPIKT